MKKFWQGNSGYVLLMAVYIIIYSIFIIYLSQPVTNEMRDAVPTAAFIPLFYLASVLLMSLLYTIGFLIAASKDKQRKRLYLRTALFTSLPLIAVLIISTS